MKRLCIILLLLAFLINGKAFAQFSLNPAVDTVNSIKNRDVIHALFKYFNARFQGTDGRVYWEPAEAKRLKAYDFYEAHSLYQITFDDVIVLGISQPENSLFKVRVLFDYIGTDKKKTVFSINDFYLKEFDKDFKLTNALFVNMRENHYKTVESEKITFHFPPDYKFSRLKIDSANRYLSAIERFFNKKIEGKITYVTAPTCESLYELFGNSYFIGTMSSSTSYCGYFDKVNMLTITSGDEFYKHELLRTLNILLPDAPDLIQSGLTSLWGGSRSKPIIYHLKRLYPYILKHPEVFNDIDNFNYFDDETVPGFVFQALVMNYVLKNGGKMALLEVIKTLKPNTTIVEFLKERYHVTDIKSFFLREFEYYDNRENLEFDDLLKIR